MHFFVSFNRRIRRAEDVAISAAASAALYGRGVFTTVAVRDRQPFLWEKHWRRLQEDAAKLEIDLSNFDKKTIENALGEIIEVNKLNNGRARITFFDESPSVLWSFSGEKKTSSLIMTADAEPAAADLRLTVSPFRVNSASPLAGVKSCNYLEKILAIGAAKKRGFGEAVQLNERGAIASACLTNIFWLADGELFTPPLAAGCLAGTTRAFLLEKLAKSGRINCVETESDLSALKRADAIFLTSAGLHVAQVAEFDGRLYERKYPDVTSIISSI